MSRFSFILIGLHLSFAGFTQKMYREETGAFYRSDTTQKNIYLIFTAHDFGDGFPFILKTLDSLDVKASFFLTGDFIRKNKKLVKSLIEKQHFVGPHSNKHLLYCDWTKRDSLLVSDKTILQDLKKNTKILAGLGSQTPLFMPPYEWYNKHICSFLEDKGYKLINFSPGTYSNADYTTPEMPSYRSSDFIMTKILNWEEKNTLNGFHLLIHAGTAPERTDKLYLRLPYLISILQFKDYHFKKLK